MSSGTTAEPIQPDAPVTKTRMRKPPGGGMFSAPGVRGDRLMSVTAITTVPDVSRCHQVLSGHGSMGAERARPARACGTGALHRARVRADHRGGDRQAGGAHGADVLPVLRRQA